jgi:hypothetical protein
MAPMTPAEALIELGIQPPATSEEVRTAYLKGLKTKRPDRDAVGFMRLRAAYELLRHDVTVEPVPDARPEPSARDASVDGIAPRTGPTDGERLQQFVERLRSTADGDLVAQEEIASAAVAALPLERAPRWWLISIRRAAGNRDGAMNVLRQAAQDFGSPFLEEWLWSFPAEASPDQIATALASPDADLQLLGARAGALRGDFATAATVLRSVMADGRPLRVQVLLSSVLSLFLCTPPDLAEAVNVGAAFDAYVAALPPATRPHGAHLALAALVRELSELPSGFPFPWRLAVVEDALGPNEGARRPDEPLPGLNVAEARLWRRKMGARFPLVEASLQLASPPPSAPRPLLPPKGSRKPLLLVGAALAIAVVVQALMKGPEPEPSSASNQLVPPPAVILAAARSACRGTSEAPRQECLDAQEMLEEMVFGDCPRARLAAAAVKARGGAPDLVEVGELATEEICKR